MKGEWCYFKNYFSPEFCQQLIDDAAMLPSQHGIVGLGNGEGVNLTTRRSRVKFIQSGDWKFQKLFDELWKTCIQANRDFFDVHVSRLNFVQLAEYNEQDQGEYRDHHDVFWLNNDPVYHRKLSCVIQLTDPNKYEGGDFELIDVGQCPPAQDLRGQGTVIFFPSFFMHRARPVTRGVRHSIAAWFEGPKWR